MKKLFLFFMILTLCTASFFADDQGDEYDDGYVYEMNGAGDQFLKMELGGFFPLNYGKQLKVGGGATIAYFKFVSNSVALGAEVSISDNFTIGNKPFIAIPITFDVMYQPSIGKFEFPLILGVGTCGLSMSALTYFPGLSARGSAGVFYRLSETWSFGAESSCIWIPEFHKDKKYNDNLLMVTAGLCARFHF